MSTDVERVSVIIEEKRFCNSSFGKARPGYMTKIVGWGFYSRVLGGATPTPPPPIGRRSNPTKTRARPENRSGGQQRANTRLFRFSPERGATFDLGRQGSSKRLISALIGQSGGYWRTVPRGITGQHGRFPRVWVGHGSCTGFEGPRRCFTRNPLPSPNYANLCAYPHAFLRSCLLRLRFAAQLSFKLCRIFLHVVPFVSTLDPR